MATTKNETKKSDSKVKAAPKAAVKPVKKSTKTTPKAKAKATPAAAKVTAKVSKKEVATPTISERFAVISIGGSQLKVIEGATYTINKLDTTKGGKIEIKEVLMVGDKENVTIGTPFVDKVTVTLVVDAQKKDKKIRVFKYKSKSRYRRSSGHRQEITRVLVEKIS